MTTASLELSKELFKLSGWEDTDFQYAGWNGKEWRLEYGKPEMIDLLADFRFKKQSNYPAYDLGYLLQKLPRYSCIEIDDVISATHTNIDHKDFTEIADTPENATVKLCIELFKQGIMTPTKERELI